MDPEGHHLLGYERIKVVGKGAFGTAVLHRRKHDDLLVIIKEINMLDLNGGERQMALNEASLGFDIIIGSMVKVLSTLQHPSIIQYFNSFEEDSVLMIEMEYADGGTLHQYLSQLERPMEEKTVLNFFSQISSAIMYMHGKHVLHRDLKTANIFLTQAQHVKIGDFGISKMTHTRAAGANTMVGTPYYISPEMCEGRSYNEKSDIWALGCVLYEMVCLHRTFEGTNLPALVHKIMKGQFAPIRGNYSHEFRQLVHDLLEQEPTFRPSAQDIVHQRLPILIRQCESQPAMGIQKLAEGDHSGNICRQQRSVLFRLKFVDGILALTPVPFPAQHFIQQLSVSSTHMVALTSDMMVYSWGDNSKGQLGLHLNVPHIENPTFVKTVKGKTVTKVGAGNGFSVFSCNNGILMTCGDGASGCLGHGDWNSISRPKIIEKLLSVDVSAVACGPHHVVIIGGERWAFSWGCGLNGRLGHGSETSLCSPVEISFPEAVIIRDARCGVDGTMFLTASGKVWACGNNSYNKLGLNSRPHFWSLRREQFQQKLTPTQLPKISGVVVDASLGPSHSALLLECGRVVTCGLNTNGQLAHDQKLDHPTLSVFESLKNRPVNMVLCGDTFTMAGTCDNTLYWSGSQQGAWNWPGSKRLSARTEPKSFVWDVPLAGGPATIRANLPLPTDANSPDTRCEIGGNGTISPQAKVTTTLREILMLYATPNQVSNGETVTLSGLHYQKSDIFVVVSTSASVAHRASCPYVNGNWTDPNESERSLDPSTTTLEMKEMIPEWLKQELQQSEKLWSHVEARPPN